jgi:AcrR family transcriptional regulator
MPQVLKDSVRARIHAAALEVFAARGFGGASMSAIAARAGVATGNLYRYHANKEALFAALISQELVRRFEALLDQSVLALSHLTTDGPPVHEGPAGEELLRFWIEHRLEVVILLDRAAETPFASFGERFVARLVALTVAQLRAAHPGVRIPGAARLVLTHIFENTRRTIAAILEGSADERSIREGIAAFRAYQIHGLRGLMGWIRAAP